VHVFAYHSTEGFGRQIYDFTAGCWNTFNTFDPATGNVENDLSKIYLDLWFEVDDDNVHRVIDLLPGLDWNGEPVGVRMVYASRDPSALMATQAWAPSSVLPCGKRRKS
jgi:hypothetical protein